MKITILLLMCIFFISPLLKASTWYIGNRTPFKISVQFKLRTGVSKEITINPNSDYKYVVQGNIDSLSLYGVGVFDTGKYFGGDQNAIILTQTINNTFYDSQCIRSEIQWNVFAEIFGQINPDAPLSIMPQQVQFLLAREELKIPSVCRGDMVTISPLYDAKTGAVIPPSIQK